MQTPSSFHLLMSEGSDILYTVHACKWALLCARSEVAQRM